jgi:hypothetical protein
MRHLASLAVALALILPPTAQAAEAPRSVAAQPAPLAGSGASRLPLDAMLHHQPSPGDVARREGDTGNNGQDLRRKKDELDALYNDIMARSAPKGQAPLH